MISLKGTLRHPEIMPGAYIVHQRVYEKQLYILAQFRYGTTPDCSGHDDIDQNDGRPHLPRRDQCLIFVPWR
jgi:hypothetical protein